MTPMLQFYSGLIGKKEVVKSLDKSFGATSFQSVKASDNCSGQLSSRFGFQMTLTPGPMLLFIPMSLWNLTRPEPSMPISAPTVP